MSHPRSTADGSGRETRPAGAKLAIGLRAALVEFARNPLNVLLVVVLPPLFVRGYGTAMEQFPEFPFVDALPLELGLVNGAMAAAAFLPGIIGLFQVISARQADGRLSLAGFGQGTLFVSRFATVGIVSVIASGAAMTAMMLDVDVEAPIVAFLALVLAGFIYGMLGMLVGAALPRELEGSLVLVFITDMDDFFSSGMMEFDSVVTNVFPLYYPHAIFDAAVFEGSVELLDVFFGLSYLIVMGVLALVIYTWLTEHGGTRA